MTKIVVTIAVDDFSSWEKNFRTNGELFQRQTIDGKYEYTMIEDGKRVVLCAEVADVDTFFRELQSSAAGAAIRADGVQRESRQFYVLDRTFRF